MCLLAMAINVHPAYKLIVCANRDEFYSRSTARPHFWKENQHVLAGKDLVKGGSWIGVTRNGKMAAVTNVREAPIVPVEQIEYSRGQLVAEFLATPVTIANYISKLEENRARFQGYNLIVGHQKEWYYLSNRAESTKLENGIHVVSNADLKTDWPKTERIKQVLKKICQSKEDEQQLIESCMNMLRDDVIFKDHQLPNTGIGLERERELSPIFIRGKTYGTRASTIILIGNDGQIKFVEQGYGPEGSKQERIEEGWLG